MRRPAARGAQVAEAEEVEEKRLRHFSQVDPRELMDIEAIVMEEAVYYGKTAPIAGHVKGLRTEGGDFYMDLRVTGTKHDELLRILSGKKDKIVSVHLCREDCGRLLTDETLLHCATFEEVDLRRLPWLTNLKDVRPPEEVDELAALRREQERVEEERRKEVDKSAKKEKKRKKKAEEDDGRGRASPKEGKEDFEVGQKPLEDLFKDTGMDPDPGRRKKILKKARKVGKGTKKKKKKRDRGSSSSEDSSNSTTESFSSDVMGEEGLFEDEKKLRVLWRRFPGALSARSIQEIQRNLITASGTLWSVNRNDLPPLFTHCGRQVVMPSMSVSLQQETLTTCQALDLLAQGRPASCMDLLTQRLKSLEALGKGAHWSLCRQYELVKVEESGMTEESERLAAGRRVREEERLRSLMTRPAGGKGSEGAPGGKTRKGKDNKGGGQNFMAEEMMSKKRKEVETDYDRTFVEVKNFPNQVSEKEVEATMRQAEEKIKDDEREEADREGADGFTSEDVANLIDEAQRGAAALEGSEVGWRPQSSHVEEEFIEVHDNGSQVSRSDDSQTFHKQIQKLVQIFLGGAEQSLAVEDLGGLVMDALQVLESPPSCKPRSKTRKNEIFPLPVARHPDQGDPKHQFLQGLVMGLNSLHDFGEEVTPERPSPMAVKVVKRLLSVLDGSVLLKEKLPKISFATFFNEKGLDYSGEEVRLAMPVTWESIEPSLPPECGSLDIRDFCSGGVLHFISNIESTLVPPEDQVPMKAPSIMIRDDQWLTVASGLISRGLCTPIAEDEVYEIQGQKLFNGLFSVSKEEIKDGVLIGRLIMNMKPWNSVSRSLSGDIGLVAVYGFWEGLATAVGSERGLTPYGQAASLSVVRGDVPEKHELCQVLSIGLFDGIGALRVALDLLNAPVAGHISVEKSPEARRVLESHFPDSICVEDIELVDEEMVKEWSLRFTSVGLVVIGSGPPCQGVSGLNTDRKGALRDKRSQLFVHVPRIVRLCKVAFPWAQVQSLSENVGSMDAKDCQAMNDEYEDEPWYIDADGISLAHRPRLYWVSWELQEEVGVEIFLGSDHALPLKGQVNLKAQVKEKAFLEAGWQRACDKAFPTFTTSRPSPHPLRRPAGLKDCNEEEKQRWREDQHRFPPYQYKVCHCLVDNQGRVRPPSVKEREAILGFPAGYTIQCMQKVHHGSERHNDCRLTLLGNSWSVGVVAWLLGQLLKPLGLINNITIQELVNKLTPGDSKDLQSLLLRTPLSQGTKTFFPSSVLVSKLAGLVSLKGEDLLLQGQSEVPVRHHRLRSGLPAKLWRWRTVAGWRWEGEAEHINVLEARAVLTTVKWRVSQRQQVNVRCVHLVDSLVVLHALTRGRSSSRRMRRTLMRINAYLLATGLQPIWAYVSTKENPADRPSRWGIKKRWVKK
eukprot:s726_g32.t1